MITNFKNNRRADMRKLRITENAGSETNEAVCVEASAERKLRFSEDPELLSKADKLLSLKTQLAVRNREIKALESEIGRLQSELLAYGKDNLLDRLTTGSTLVEFTPRVSRRINPKSFLSFLQSHGRTREFYDFVDVPLTRAIKNFGEAVLESSGVISSFSTPYAGLKVSALK